MEFDFEQDVLKLLPRLDDDSVNHELGNMSRVGDHKRKKVVCRHWLSGLCHNRDRCDYLHRLDRNRMPICKHGNLCKIKNCPLKHIGMYFVQLYIYVLITHNNFSIQMMKQSQNVSTTSKAFAIQVQSVQDAT